MIRPEIIKNIAEEIEYIQNRLGLLNSGKKTTWSLKDRQIVSALCIEATQQSVQADSAFCVCKVSMPSPDYTLPTCRFCVKPQSR